MTTVSNIPGLILTENMTEAWERPGLSRKELKSFVENRHTSAEINVAHKLYKKTTVISSGYTSMIRVCNHI